MWAGSWGQETGFGVPGPEGPGGGMGRVAEGGTGTGRWTQRGIKVGGMGSGFGPALANLAAPCSAGHSPGLLLADRHPGHAGVSLWRRPIDAWLRGGGL